MQQPFSKVVDVSEQRSGWKRAVKYLFTDLYALPSKVILAPEVAYDVRLRLMAMVTRFLLQVGIPFNIFVTINFIAAIQQEKYPVVSIVVHLISFIGGYTLSAHLLRRFNGIIAFYSIFITAIISSTVTAYITDDISLITGMVLVTIPGSVALTINENIRLTGIIVGVVLALSVLLSVQGDLFTNLSSIIFLHFLFILLGEGIRRVLRQTVADQQAATAQAVRAEATAAQADQAAVERERDRFTRDLHDRLGNAFTSIGVQAEVAVRALPNDMPVDISEARAALLNVQHLADTGVDRLRRTIRNLRDEAVLQCSLPELVERELKELRHTGVQATLECPPSLPKLSPDIVGELLRVVQESLTNVQRHARATAVTVYLDHREAKSVSLIIEDNGQGCDPSCVTTGFGLKGIQERVAALGGVFHPWTEPGQGFQVIVEVPLCV